MHNNTGYDYEIEKAVEGEAVVFTLDFANLPLHKLTKLSELGAGDIINSPSWVNAVIKMVSMLRDNIPAMLLTEVGGIRDSTKIFVRGDANTADELKQGIIVTLARLGVGDH